MNRHLNAIFVSSLAAIALVGCGSDSGAGSSTGSTGTSGTGSAAGGSVKINGAGSSFVMPAMKQWTYAYQEAHKDVVIDYEGKGSGAGIAQYKAGTVDFGASDAPLSDKDLTEMPGPTVQIPVVSGCDVLAYNLPGVATGLKLSPDAVADIFLGKIKTWNDPKIAADNPGVKLPSTVVSVVHRSDGSGTTYIFTDYLSSISPAWASGPGKGKTVQWPVGVGGAQNDGVASLIKQTPGSIGYVELAYAVQTKLTDATLKNKDGNFVVPSIDSTAAAVASAADALKKDVRVSIVNEGGKDSYPIAGFTYVLLAKNPKDAAKSKAVVDFMKWCITDGQAMSKTLQYAPLPKDIVDIDTTLLDSVKAGS